MVQKENITFFLLFEDPKPHLTTVTCPRLSPGGGVQRPARPGHRDRVGSGPRHGGTAALRAADVAAPGQAAGHGGALGIGGSGKMAKGMGWGMKWEENLENSRESRKSSCFS